MHVLQLSSLARLRHEEIEHRARRPFRVQEPSRLDITDVPHRHRRWRLRWRRAPLPAV